jgi:gliding motility-associated-like protein
MQFPAVVIIRFVFACLTILCSTEAIAQNLVPNSSFEDYNNCPVNGQAPYYPQIVYSPGYTSFPAVKGWVSPLSSTSSPDYFNACAPPPAFTNVPYAAMGYQQARTGNAYMGIYIMYQPTNLYGYREYIECRLLSPLKAGTRYKVSFYVSSNDVDYIAPDYNYVAIDQIGAWLTTTQVDSPLKITGVNAQLQNPPGNYLIDSIGWMSIADTITATGGEHWLTIGNFELHTLPSSRKQLYPLTTAPFKYFKQYVYIDDVCILDIDNPTETDTAICVATFPATIKTRIQGTYKWNTGDTTQTISIQSPGKYWCEVTGDCAYNVDTIVVIDQDKYLLHLGNDTVICEGADFVIAANDVYDTYLWNTGAETRSLNISQSGQYILTVNSTCGQFSDTVMVQVTGKPANHLDDAALFCRDAIMEIGSKEPGVSYLWNTGDTSCCIKPSEAGWYVRNAINECATVSDSIMVELQECKNCMYVPTVFSPNGDGLNDLFGGIPLCPVKSYLLQVYNRWGQRVFVSEEPSQKWDGSYKGKQLDPAVFYYMLEYIQTNTSLQIKRRLKGDITLVK